MHGMLVTTEEYIVVNCIPMDWKHIWHFDRATTTIVAALQSRKTHGQMVWIAKWVEGEKRKYPVSMECNIDLRGKHLTGRYSINELFDRLAMYVLFFFSPYAVSI